MKSKMIVYEFRNLASTVEVTMLIQVVLV